MNIEESIKQKLKSAFNIELLEVINESPMHQVPENSETHFRILIVSNDFKGLSTVKRHQRVYQVLSKELAGPVHAFSQKTLTPQEWRALGSHLSDSPPCQHKFDA